jgi:hypothetical protein
MATSSSARHGLEGAQAPFSHSHGFGAIRRGDLEHRRDLPDAFVATRTRLAEMSSIGFVGHCVISSRNKSMSRRYAHVEGRACARAEIRAGAVGPNRAGVSREGYRRDRVSGGGHVVQRTRSGAFSPARGRPDCLDALNPSLPSAAGPPRRGRELARPATMPGLSHSATDSAADLRDPSFSRAAATGGIPRRDRKAGA